MTDELGADDDPIAQSRERGVARVSALTIALAVVAGLLLISTVERPTMPSVPWWFIVSIGAGYVVAERHVFRIEYRREAISFSLSEVPTAFALAFLGPLWAIGLRIVSSLGAIAITARQESYKLLFNGVLFAFEIAVAYAVMDQILPAGAGSAWLLVAIAASLTIVYVLGAAAVSLAISCFEGAPFARLVDELRTSAVLAPVSSTVAALAIAPALIDLRLSFLSLIPIGAVWFVLLQHGRLTQRHRNLEGIHDFLGTVGRSLDLDEIAPRALQAALQLLRAERGALQIYAADGSILAQHISTDACPVAPTSTSDPRWRSVFESPHATSFSVDRHDRVHHPDRSLQKIAVPIRDETSLLGLLLVSDRTGPSAHFGADDLRLASRLGEQLATSLRNASLHADIEHAALHDVLTGDLNRLGFEGAVAERLSDPASAHGAAVLMLDLDRFKEINDTFGHQLGDQLLCEFARRVRDVLEPDDLVARFGGDEFAVFLQRPDQQAFIAAAEQILSGSHSAIALEEHDVVVTTSVGIAPATEHDRSTADIVRRADIAMYAAKRAHAGYEIYREELDRRTPERLALLGDLRHALDAGDLDVHFQPKLDLATSTVVGAEALVRWRHAAKGWVNPIEFVQVAEESGLIRQLTDQVLSVAIRTAAEWDAAGHRLRVSVNLSTLDLLDERLPYRIADRLERYQLDAELLTLEITESSLMVDTPRTMATVDQLNELGVRLSLDDFGTGYASLSYLRQLPVDVLKIDRSFVTNLMLDAQDEVIVRSTIDLGHNLGLEVVAEGIENEQVLSRLRTMGCDLGQGYGISRPLPRDLFERWLRGTEFNVIAGGPNRRGLASVRAVR